jgi:hypothetical protein
LAALVGSLALRAGAAQAGEPAVPPLVTYDLTPSAHANPNDPRAVRAAWDEAHAVSTLQGIVNRKRARLYLFFIGESGGTDRFWWDLLHRPGGWLHGRPDVAASSVEDLVARFRSDVKGAVVYDERVPATSNVASTIAGIEDLIAVRYDPAPGSLYDRLVNHGPKLPVAVRLINADGSPMFTGEGHLPGLRTPSTGSAKTDAYLWAKEKYFDTGRASSTRMAFYIDADWLKRPGAGGDIANHTLTNHDFFVSERAFFFDLSPWEDEPATDDPGAPRGGDYRLLQSLLLSAWNRNHGKKMLHVGGFIPWAFKYTRHGGGGHDDVPTEWEYARLLSAYNAYMDADALGIGAMANASFFRHFPLKKRYPQKAPQPTAQRLTRLGYLTPDGKVKPGRYYTFYLGDWDSAAWLYRMMPGIWQDPNRGELPLGWAINPNLADRMPVAMDWLRETATPNDYFMTGDSGAGYVNPGMLQEPRPISGLSSGLDAWVAHNRPYFRQWDLHHVGFVIDGFAPGLDEAGFRAYARFAPGGIVPQKVPPLSLRDGMPVVRMASDLDGKPDQAADTIARNFGEGASEAPKKPEVRIFRAILKSPTWYQQVADAVEARHPEGGYTFVDPFSFFELSKRIAEGR